VARGVALVVPIPEGPTLELEHLVLDVNGTLTDRGELLDGVSERLGRLRERLELQLVSGDTFGTLDEVSRTLGLTPRRVTTGAEKAEIVRNLGAPHCAVIGNGANDVFALEAAALGIAVVGPEGASGAAVRAADVVCRSVVEALDLLLDPQVLGATLRP
jgi:P-type E1-E2 ATPase